MCPQLADVVMHKGIHLDLDTWINADVVLMNKQMIGIIGDSVRSVLRQALRVSVCHLFQACVAATVKTTKYG